jgi:predicted nucleic acid-binding protein
LESDVAVVVSDTSPVRCLVHLQRTDLLRTLFGDVLVPPAVAHELAHPNGAFVPVDIGTIPELKVQAPTDAASVAAFAAVLQAGESEALALVSKSTRGRC